MARGNMFLGQARGRVGSVVFSRRMGKQITRTYNAEPANPKSRAQALQRAQFSTVIAASVGLKEVINNSFDGSKNGQESVNKFVSVNLSDLRSRAANGDPVALKWLVPKGQSFIQPQPWIISQGNIGPLNAHTTALEIHFHAVGDDDEPDYLEAYANDLARQWYYKPGCQITFVALILETNEATGEKRIIPHINRVVFNNIAPTGEAQILKAWSYETPFIPAEFVDLTKTDLPLKNSGTNVSLPAYYTINNAGDLDLKETAYEGALIGIGMITTYLENGVYRHTTSVMDFDDEAYVYTEDAVSTYMKQAQKIISSDYYTEQPGTDNNDWDLPTLNQIVSAQINAEGMEPKGVFIGQSNSYGPVAEGSQVQLWVNLPARFQIRANSVKAYNGETPLGNDWHIFRQGANQMSIAGPMPTTTSFPFNVSFEVDDSTSGSNIGRAALRINVSKANS